MSTAIKPSEDRVLKLPTSPIKAPTIRIVAGKLPIDIDNVLGVVSQGKGAAILHRTRSEQSRQTDLTVTFVNEDFSYSQVAVPSNLPMVGLKAFLPTAHGHLVNPIHSQWESSVYHVTHAGRWEPLKMGYSGPGPESITLKGWDLKHCLIRRVHEDYTSFHQVGFDLNLLDRFPCADSYSQAKDTEICDGLVLSNRWNHREKIGPILLLTWKGMLVPFGPPNAREFGGMVDGFSNFGSGRLAVFDGKLFQQDFSDFPWKEVKLPIPNAGLLLFTVGENVVLYGKDRVFYRVEAPTVLGGWDPETSPLHLEAGFLPSGHHFIKGFRLTNGSVVGSFKPHSNILGPGPAAKNLHGSASGEWKPFGKPSDNTVAVTKDDGVIIQRSHKLQLIDPFSDETIDLFEDNEIRVRHVYRHDVRKNELTMLRSIPGVSGSLEVARVSLD